MADGSDEKRGVSGPSKSKPGIVSRRLALEVLIKVERDKAYANLALSQAFKRKNLSQKDRAFVTALVQGVVRKRLSLDDRLSKLCTRPLSKMPETLVNVLRLGLFQLDEMPDIPRSAVLDTSNDLARLTGNAGHPKFVNAVLRNYLRRSQAASADGDKGDTVDRPATEERAQNEEQNQDRERDRDRDREDRQGQERSSFESGAGSDNDSHARKLSLKYSVPEWIVERWLNNFGESETESLLEYANKPPELVLRTCETAVTSAGLAEILRANKVLCHPGELVESCLIVDKKPPGPPEKIVGYSEGLFSFQDEAAAFVSLCVEPKKGELIVDLCAAPGGKALHLGELMENSGRVVAVDVSAGRLNLIKKNRARLSLTNIETVAADGRTFKPDRLADRVLVDAPCTGTGVINRRADLRYQRSIDDLASLSQLQRELLENAASMVKPGGILVYATCSLEPEENFDNIRWFLKEHQNFEGDSFAHLLSKKVQIECQASFAGPLCKTEPEMTRVYMLQLMPTRHGVSGFFIARLRRKD